MKHRPQIVQMEIIYNTLQNRRIKYSKPKVVLYTQIRRITQSDNKEITQLVGLHIRCMQCVHTDNNQ